MTINYLTFFYYIFYVISSDTQPSSTGKSVNNIVKKISKHITTLSFAFLCPFLL